jgi:hypothetical protein
MTTPIINLLMREYGLFHLTPRELNDRNRDMFSIEVEHPVVTAINIDIRWLGKVRRQVAEEMSEAIQYLGVEPHYFCLTQRASEGFATFIICH